MRIQKFLSNQAVASRRTIEQWIAAGRIHVNGAIATIGMHVHHTDCIMLDQHVLKFKTAVTTTSKPRVLLFHKPEGIICTNRDPQNRPTIFQYLPKITGARWITVGRLDLNTSGLLLVTTDGDLAHRLMHPSSVIEREYVVRIAGALSMTAKKNMLTGVRLDDGMARFKSIQAANQQHPVSHAPYPTTGTKATGYNWYKVVIMEGRKREVRRLFQSQNLTVNRLIRIRFGPIHLPKTLRKGDYIELSPDEVNTLRP